MIKTAIFAALLASPVYAGLQPPARFDFEYEGPTVIERLPTDNVRRACMARFGTDWGASSMKGCGGEIDGVCYIIVGRYAKVSSVPMLIRHERAHCNGWSATHEH